MATELIYRTLRSIDNPVGDGRHDRATWQSPLFKRRIPAGFVFALSEDGSIRDLSYSPPERVLTGDRANDLKKLLVSVAGPPLAGDLEEEEESFDAVINAHGGPEAATKAMCAALNLTPSQLAAFLRDTVGKQAATLAPAPEAKERTGKVKRGVSAKLEDGAEKAA